MADNQVLAKSKMPFAKCGLWPNAICKFEKEKSSFNVTVTLAAQGTVVAGAPRHPKRGLTRQQVKSKVRMKKIIVSTVIVMVGLLNLPADIFTWESGDGGFGGFGPVTPPGLTAVHFNLSILGQGETNVVTNFLGTATVVHFKQSRIDDDDILGLINDEFGTSFSVTNGDHLAVSNFWDGKLIVLGRDGTNLLSNASKGTTVDGYVLDLTYSNVVSASTETTNCESKVSVMEGFLNYRSGVGGESFSLEGFTTVNDSWRGTNSAESFQLSGGIGSASFGTNGLSGVLTGSVYGSGRNNAPAP